jgi:ATP-dependent DNA helicase RecQ
MTISKEWAAIREGILIRDERHCQKCGGRNDLHVHHLIPRYAGGQDVPDNLITLCAACHAERHMTLQGHLARKYIEIWGQKLARLVDVNKRLPEEEYVLGPLLRIFGVNRFREGQLDVILSIMKGDSVLYISPTGSGKSLCFQLPALGRKGFSLVLSPLKTLMYDQVLSLQKKQIPATFINGDLTISEKKLRYDLIDEEMVKLVYCAPERFGEKVGQEEKMRMKSWRPNFLVIDEAHVIAKWKKTFRPDYGRIKEISDKLDCQQVVSFTATAGIPTQEKIIEEMGIEDIKVFVRDVNRPNIFLSIINDGDFRGRAFKIKEKLQALKSGEKAIIFVPTVKIGNIVKDQLAEIGLDVPFYHSQLKMLERDELLNRFLDNQSPGLNTIICTNAFGMGIDIPNIRLVVHWQHPASIEDYVQEYGRAGRDGGPAEAILFTNLGSNKDFEIQKYMIKLSLGDSPLATEEKRSEYTFQIGRLEDMVAYTKLQDGCLRSYINKYFDKDYDKRPKVPFSYRILRFIYTRRQPVLENGNCCSHCLKEDK